MNKLDGYRLQVTKGGPTLRLYSRRGHEGTKRLADGEGSPFERG